MLVSLLAVFFFAVVAPMSTVIVTAEIQGNVTSAEIINKAECSVSRATWRTCTTGGHHSRPLRRTAVRGNGGVRGARRRDLSSDGNKKRVLKGSKKDSKKGSNEGTDSDRGLAGKQVEGTLQFDFREENNSFDPSNGDVPANAGPQPLTVVSYPDVQGFVEFEYLDTFSGLLVDIDDTSITIQQPIVDETGNANSWEIILDFEDLDKIKDVIIVSDTFDGGVSVSFTDTTITILSPDVDFFLDGNDEVTLAVAVGN